jgi:hypothetical protein
MSAKRAEVIDWTKERPAIAAAAAIHRVDPDFIEAVRVAWNEMGSSAFGLPEAVYEGYETQLLWACHEVASRLTSYVENPLILINHKARYNRPFVRWFARICALPREGDTHEGLNVAWLTIVWDEYMRREGAK